MEDLINELQMRKLQIKEIDAQMWGLNERKTAFINQCIVIEGILRRAQGERQEINEIKNGNIDVGK